MATVLRGIRTPDESAETVYEIRYIASIKGSFDGSIQQSKWPSDELLRSARPFLRAGVNPAALTELQSSSAG